MTETALDVGGVHDGGLALDVTGVGGRFQDDRLGGGGNHPAGGTEEAGRLVQADLDVSGRRHEPGDDQVAEGVAGEFVGVGIEALFEDLGQEGVVVGQGHQAFAQVPGGDDAHLAPEAPGRAPVVGHRDDAGDGTGVQTGGPEAGRQAVAATDGHHPRATAGRHRSTSRWKTDGVAPRSSRRLASSTARTTDRCRPPVQPMAMVRYDFPSAR